MPLWLFPKKSKIRRIQLQIHFNRGGIPQAMSTFIQNSDSLHIILSKLPIADLKIFLNSSYVRTFRQADKPTLQAPSNQHLRDRLPMSFRYLLNLLVFN